MVYFVTCFVNLWVFPKCNTYDAIVKFKALLINLIPVNTYIFRMYAVFDKPIRKTKCAKIHIRKIPPQLYTASVK